MKVCSMKIKLSLVGLVVLALASNTCVGQTCGHHERRQQDRGEYTEEYTVEMKIEEVPVCKPKVVNTPAFVVCAAPVDYSSPRMTYNTSYVSCQAPVDYGGDYTTYSRSAVTSRGGANYHGGCNQHSSSQLSSSSGYNYGGCASAGRGSYGGARH